MIEFLDTAALLLTMGGPVRTVDLTCFTKFEEALLVAHSKLAQVLGVRSKDSEVPSLECMQLRESEFVRTGEVAWVGETDSEVGPDDHDEEDGVHYEDENGCWEGADVVVGVTKVGEVDTDQEDVDGEEGRRPEIECWEHLCDVWLCARGRASKKPHDVDVITIC